MKNDHPIVISECPKCGAMKAARSEYLEPLKDEAGNPDPKLVYLMKIECLGCFEITPVPPPSFISCEFGGVRVSQDGSLFFPLVPQC